MKFFGNILLISAMALTLSSCGKDNVLGGEESSSSSSSSSSSMKGINFKNYTELRDYYNKKSLTAGLADKDIIYHVGPEFGGQDFYQYDFDFDFDFDFGYCINLFGELKGDCADNQNNNNYNLDQFQAVVNNGEYMKVVERSSSKIDIDLATSASGYGLVYERGVFNKDDAMFREMLNLDKKAVAKVVISKATVNAYDEKAKKNVNLVSDYVEYFLADGSNTVRGFVVSSQLPLIANPIAVTTNFNYVGALSYGGRYTIRSITVNLHDIQFDSRTGKYTSIPIGSRTFTVNQQF